MSEGVWGKKERGKSGIWERGTHGKKEIADVVGDVYR